MTRAAASLAVAAAAMLGACGGSAPQPSGASGALVVAPGGDYPDGARTVAGFSATREDLAADATAAAVRARIAADGFRRVRMDVLWHEVEVAPGVFDFSAADVIVDDLLARGLAPLVVLAYGHPDYHAGACPNLEDPARCPPADLTPFLRYVRQTAAHFRGRVAAYEVWNEANGWFRFWPTRAGGDPAAYAAMCAAAAAAVHEVCAACEVLSGGLVYLDFPPVVPGQDLFLGEMLAAEPGLFRALDGMGVHHYTFYPPVNAPEDEGFHEVPLDEILHRSRRVCACDDPLWITEAGWTASGGVDEAHRAQFAARAYLIALAHGARSWLWWSIRKLDRADLIAPQEANFGMLTPAGQPLPVYAAMRTTLAAVGDAIRVADVRAEYGFRGPAAWAVRLTFPDGSRADALWVAASRPVAAPDAIVGLPAVNLVTGQSVTVGALGPEPVLVARP